MLRHGWLCTGTASLGLALLVPGGPEDWGFGDLLFTTGEVLAVAEPPDPTPIDPEELEELRWRFIIKLLCAIIPCRPTDPDCESTQSATACLHVRLDRFESEGLLDGLSQSTVEEWIGHVDELIEILSGTYWQSLVSDSQERDGLLAQLALLRAALEGQMPSRVVGGT
jgi:hypothetical protein